MNENQDQNQNQYNPIILPRHTYSEANAKRFKEAFDKSIEQKTDEFISCEDAKLSLNSLRQRCNEAFLWLTNNEIKDSKYKQEDYRLLRSKVKVKAVSYGGKDGILISWYISKEKFNKHIGRKEMKSIASISTKSSVDDSYQDSSDKKSFISWKERILKFIEDDKKTFLELSDPQTDFQGKLLTDIDVEWITNTLTSAGIEFEVGPNKIIASK